MYSTQDYERDHEERRQQAQERGEGLRAEIKARLEGEGEQRAVDLLPHMPKDVSLAEVAFQLERLADEGEAGGEAGGSYSLV